MQKSKITISLPLWFMIYFKIPIIIRFHSHCNFYRISCKYILTHKLRC